MRTRYRKPNSISVPEFTGYYRPGYSTGTPSAEFVATQSYLTGTNEFIADTFPHKRDIAFPAMEHFKVEVDDMQRGATSGYTRGAPGDGTCPASFSQLQVWWNYPYLHQTDTLDNLLSTRYDPAHPWHEKYYSFAEPQSWSAEFSARIARWGAGRGGLAESLGESPELPKLWQFVQKGRGYYRNASNAYLAYSFGWRPLLDLIPGVMSEIRGYLADKRPAARRETGSRKLVFRMPIRPPWDEKSEVTISDPCPEKWPQIRRYIGSSFTFTRCEAIGMYDAVISRKPFTGYEILERLVDLDGIPTFRTVWELVPMSFVVDYFASIGGLISRMQGNLLYDIDVSQAALGVRIEGSGSCSSFYGVNNMTTSHRGSLRYYWRGPMPTGFIALSFPGAHTIPTGIALAMQRCPRLPRRLTNAAKRGLYKALRSRYGQYVTNLSAWSLAFR